MTLLTVSQPSESFPRRSLSAELNGETLDARVFRLGSIGERFSISAQGPAVAEKLSALTASEVHPSIESLSFSLPSAENSEETFSFALNREAAESRGSLFVEYAVENWKKMWSFNEYRGVLAALAVESGVMYEEKSGPFFQNWVYLWTPISSKQQPLGEIANELKTVWEFCHAEAENRLSSSIGTESVAALFEFPEEIRVPCEQYLLYFLEFLRHVGVSATAELQHRATGVLFAVKPSSGPEALDAIRRALEVYLELPSAHDLEPFSVASEIHVQQLISNIQHLRGQLALASAVLQAKDATIEQQQLVISFQKQLLTGEVISASLREISGKSTDAEEILGGAAALTTYEGPGFEIRLSEIFRKVRSWFKGDSG